MSLDLTLYVCMPLGQRSIFLHQLSFGHKSRLTYEIGGLIKSKLQRLKYPVDIEVPQHEEHFKLTLDAHGSPLTFVHAKDLEGITSEEPFEQAALDFITKHDMSESLIVVFYWH